MPTPVDSALRATVRSCFAGYATIANEQTLTETWKVRQTVPRILVVDDEAEIVGFVRRALHSREYATESAHSPEECLKVLSSEEIDLIVLDLMMPRVTETSLVESIRHSYPNVKIIVLSAVLDVRLKVRCLGLGAVDYVTKPFSIAELLARIELRLAEGKESRGIGTKATSVGTMTLDPQHQTVGMHGKRVALSQREFLLLAKLSEADGPVTREQLLADVWGYNFDTDSNVVDVYVKRLRTKLGAGVIETVRNVGYRVAAA